VAGDRRILDVGKTPLGEAGAAGAEGGFGQGNRREKTVKDQLFDQLEAEGSFDSVSNEFAPGTHDGHRNRFLRVPACRELPFGRFQQQFFGLPALVPQLMPAPGVELARFAKDLGFDVAGEREIHVIAAEHQMFSNREAVEAQAFVPPADSNDGKIRGASADVANQYHLTFLHPVFPVGFMLGQPGIKGSKGFFDENHPRQTGLGGCRHGEFPGDLIKRRRYREDDQLFFETIPATTAGNGFIPDFPQVLQVTGAGLNRRNLVHIGTHGPGQDRRDTIYPSVAEPGFGGGHQAAGNQGSLLAGEFTDYVSPFRVPRQAGAAWRQFMGTGKIEKRGENRSPPHFPRRCQLRNLEKPDMAGGGLSTGEIDVSHGRIGGAEVDPDDITIWQICSFKGSFHKIQAYLTRGEKGGLKA